MHFDRPGKGFLPTHSTPYPDNYRPIKQQPFPGVAATTFKDQLCLQLNFFCGQWGKKYQPPKKKGKK